MKYPVARLYDFSDFIQIIDRRIDNTLFVLFLFSIYVATVYKKSSNSA